MCFPTNADEHFRSFIFHLSGCCGLMTEKGGSVPVVAVSVGFFLSDSNSLAEPRFADNPECRRFSCERGFLFFGVLASRGCLPGLAGGVGGSGR